MGDGETRTAAVSSLLDRILDAPQSAREHVLATVCAEHPEHADLLRRRLDALGGLGLLDDDPGGGMAVPAELGEFRLERQLGGGGMGVVYRARQERLGRDVALKLIRPELVFFENNRERFQREAEAVARLEHPGIVPVLTFGEQAGIPYLAMPFVDGCSLADVVDGIAAREVHGLAGDDLARAAGAESLAAPSWCGAAARVCLRVAEALAHAHERGVVHRDVKPSNVMLARDGRVLLVDFGLAAAAGTSRLTRTGTQLGSLPYSSPEQVQGDGRPVDARTDVFSLGVVLYELLTLERPFAGDNNQQMMRAILTREPADPRRRNGTVSAELAAIVAKALEKEPQHRYPSARALADDLSAFLEYRPVAVARHAGWQRVRRWVRREPMKAVAVGSVLVAVLSLAALAGWWVANAPLRAAGRAKLAADALESDLARGYLALAHGDRGAAERAFRAARSRRPDSAAARAGLGLLGIVEVEEHDVGPESEPAVLFQQAMRVLFAGPRGDKDSARRAQLYLEAASSRTASARPLYRFALAQAAAVAGDAGVAAREAVALRELWPDSPFAHYWAGYSWLEIDPERAARALSRAVRIDATFARAWSDLGLARLRNGDAGGAESALRRAIELEEDNARAHLNLGIVLDLQGDPEGAKRHLAKAIELEDLPGAHYNLGRVLQKAGEADAAALAYEKTLAREPRYAEALHNLGSLSFARGDMARAEASFRRLTKLAPESAAAFQGLGAALAGQNDLQGAIRAYEKVVELAPADAGAHEYLCTLLSHAGARDRLRAERARWARVTGKESDR